MDLIAHPFRLAANGSVATVPQDSDEADTQGLAILLLTRKGERALVPDFGVTDPTYDVLDLAEVNVGLIDYGPDVRVTAVEVDQPTDTLERVTLTYEESP